MLNQSNVLADFHVHTTKTYGGLSTVREILGSARQNGIKYVAITDPDNRITRTDLAHLSEVVSVTDVILIPGVEYTDLSCSLEGAGMRLVGGDSPWNMLAYHPVDYPDFHPVGNLLANFKNACKTYSVKAIAHPQRHLTKMYSSEEAQKIIIGLAELCLSKQLFFEINLSRAEREEEALLHTVLQEFKENAALNFVLGSGSHYCENVGRFERELAFLNEFSISESRVLNFDEKQIRAIYTR